jgi:tetratricopeptide (TPR) repeat protein
MALFGAPIAHEDHAQRACYAALHLTEELRRYARELRLERGLSFSVRMGLNSGEVIVGKIGDDLRMDYTAQGHTVGLAARMEQLAEPGKVCLTEDTAKLIEGYFQLENLGPVRITGMREPIHVFELQGVGELRTRIDVSRMRGFSRFVGRVEEMQALEAALTRAREGQAQVIGVVGEAGAGKSRLCLEFLERIRGRGITTNEAHGLAHGKATPLVPILELFRGYYGITEQDTDRVAREKIAGRLLLLDEAFREALPLQFEFLGVPDPDQPALRIDPEARQRQLFAVMKRVIQLTGQDQTVVTLLEDLHWFDAGSDAFVEQFVEAIQGTRGLLVLTFRPEYHAAWMQKSYYQQLPMLPLGAEAIRELLEDLLGTDPSLLGLAERVQEQTGGNPFFIEEVVQSLVESGQLEGSKGAYRLTRPVAQIAVPETVQSVLMARIDRLPEHQKQLLQTAAVIGKTFFEGVLAEVAELPDVDLRRSLEGLKAAEFIYESAIYPQLEFAFKHPLTQEVAYASQLTERRQRIHAAVARTLAELDPEKLDEHAALLAHHWGGAGETLEAARWHRRAAEWIWASDVSEALRHWQRVTTLLDDGPASAEADELGALARVGILQACWRVGLSEADIAGVFEEAAALARRIGSVNLEMYAMVNCGAAQAVLVGNEEARLELGQRAYRLAEEAGNPGLMLSSSGVRCYSLRSLGRLAECVELARPVIEAPPADPMLGGGVFGFAPYLGILNMAGAACVCAGRLEEAAALAQRSLEAARVSTNPEDHWTAAASASFIASMRGDTDAGLSHARRSLEISEQRLAPLFVAISLSYLGLAHANRGEWTEAIATLEDGVELFRRTGSRGLLSEMLPYLAGAYLGAGRAEDARGVAEETVIHAHRWHCVLWEANGQLALSRALMRPEVGGTDEEIEFALGAAEKCIEQSGARLLEAQLHEARAEWARFKGDEGVHQHELGEAHRLYTEMGATGHAKRLAKELGL